jgi:hypothetical protein
MSLAHFCGQAASVGGRFYHGSHACAILFPSVWVWLSDLCPIEYGNSDGISIVRSKPRFPSFLHSLAFSLVYSYGNKMLFCELPYGAAQVLRN